MRTLRLAAMRCTSVDELIAHFGRSTGLRAQPFHHRNVHTVRRFGIVVARRKSEDQLNIPRCPVASSASRMTRRPACCSASHVLAAGAMSRAWAAAR